MKALEHEINKSEPRQQQKVSCPKVPPASQAPKVEARDGSPLTLPFKSIEAFEAQLEERLHATGAEHMTVSELRSQLEEAQVIIMTDPGACLA